MFDGTAPLAVVEIVNALGVGIPGASAACTIDCACSQGGWVCGCVVPGKTATARLVDSFGNPVPPSLIAVSSEGDVAGSDILTQLSDANGFLTLPVSVQYVADYNDPLLSDLHLVFEVDGVRSNISGNVSVSVDPSSGYGVGTAQIVLGEVRAVGCGAVLPWLRHVRVARTCRCSGQPRFPVDSRCNSRRFKWWTP